MKQLEKETKKLQSIIEKYGVITRDFLKGYKPDNNAFYKTVFYNILKRQTINLSSINILLENFVEAPGNKYQLMPIGIIMRSSLLDCLTLIYFVDFINNNSNSEEAFKKEFARLNVHTVKEFLEHCTQLKEKIKIKEIFPENLNDDYTINKQINPLSTKTIFKRISIATKDELALQLLIKTCYDNYLFYSKYDHLSLIGITAMEENISNLLGKLYISTYNVIQISIWILKSINANEDIQNELKSLLDQLEPLLKNTKK